MPRTAIPSATVAVACVALLTASAMWLCLVDGRPTRAEPLKDRLKSPPPNEPAEALRTFQTRDGFRMEIVAHEPQVTSPVAAAYDEDGRLFVVEMRDYPDPLKPGEKPLGRVRLLEDRDGDRNRRAGAGGFRRRLRPPRESSPRSRRPTGR